MISFIYEIFGPESWRRLVRAVNLILGGYPFQTVEALPAIGDVKDSYTVFDKATGKVYTASGGIWQAHW